MMLPCKLQKIIVGAIACAVAFCTISLPVLAAEPHEDPEAAEQAFSGISLLHYYSSALDFVLKKEPAEVKARLERMPFANVPQELEEATDNFATSGISISQLVVEVDEDLSQLRTLVAQYRFDEASQLADETCTILSRANQELELIEEATRAIGKWFGAPSAPVGSTLRNSYDEVLERIQRIMDMLALYEDILTNLLMGTMPAEVLADILEEVLHPTGLTLKIEPRAAFVGDGIRFEGILTSNGKPLARREIDILLNGSPYITVKTETNGLYHGALQVPYWYMPEMDLQTLYYPRGKDIGVYISSLSPLIKLKVLYYEAGLEVTLEDKAYPGLETTVTGRFDYGQSPVPLEREVEIYLDDVLITEFKAGEKFSQEIELDPGLDVGKHTITVSAVAAGRYSPAVTSAILNVTRATPVLDINMPSVAMIPGSISLGGRLYSQLGPISGALVRMRLGESQVEMVSSEDGTFETEMKMGMVLSLTGSQDLGIQAVPQEPWNTTLVTTRNIVTVNMISCGVLLILIVVLGIYLPRRLGFRIRAYSWRRVRAPAAVTRPEPAPVYAASVFPFAVPEDGHETDGEPRNRVFEWYRLMVRLVQRVTEALLSPHQTLREFSRESGKVLGPAANYFYDLTRMVERLLYSRYRATERDVEKSKQLSGKMEEGLKGESI